MELVNSYTRWWTIAQLRPTMERAPLLLTLGGLVLRLLLVGALFIVALAQGLLPGLLAFLGLWLTRFATVIWVQTSGRAKLYVSAERERPRQPGPEST